MSRKGLTRIESAQKRQDILVYDLEWYPGRAIPGEGPKKLRNNLRLIGLYDGERYRSFTDMDAFFDELFTHKNDGKWIYAHYGGMADMQFVLRHIVEKGGDYKVSASFSGSSAIIVKVKRGQNEWTFIDSFWLLRDKLARLGEAVGRKKLSDAYECSDFPACGHIDPLDEPYRHRGDGSCSHFSKHVFEDMHEVLICQHCGEWRPKSLCTFYAPLAHLITYNEQDCVILYEAIKQFEEALLSLGGELQMTIASCAMRLFRRKYLTDDIKNKAMGMGTINNIARQAYTSSRVEVFQKECPSNAFVERLHQKGFGQCALRCFDQWKERRFPYAEYFPFIEKRNFEGYSGAPLCPRCVQFAMHNRAHYYDLNSSFPYAMTFPAPGNVKKRREGKLPKKSDAIYLADVEVTVPEMYLPPLPFRHESRVFFPFGTWRAWMSNVDIDLLLEKGGLIRKVYESVEFHPQTYLRDYAIDIYERRKNATSKYEKLVLKYLLNSLYGKFGERPEKTSMLLYPDDTNCPHEPRHRCKDFPYCEHGQAGQECNLCMQLLWPGCFLVTHEGEVAHEWVPIGVHITAIARKNLYNHLWDAQDDIYYCDTDSVITTSELPSDPKTLGALKLEEDIWCGEFVAPKVYAAKVADSSEKDRIGEDIVKAKGFSRMTYQKFCEIKEGERIQIARMTRLRELYRKRETEPEEAVIEKRLVQKLLPKRCELSDGQSRPWGVHEIQSDHKDASIQIAVSQKPPTAKVRRGRLRG